MDVLLPLSQDATDCTESLKNMSKYLTYDKIYVAGIPRKWLSNVTYIPSDEHEIKWTTPGKQRRLFNAYILASLSDISDPFIVWNDDYFLTEPFDFKYHSEGTLEDLSKKTSGPYRQAVDRTMNYLKMKGKSIINYDVHLPIVFEKKKLQELLRVDQSLGMLTRSLYCNA